MKQEDIQKFLAASGLPEHLAVQAAQEYDVVGLKRYQEIKELFLSFVRVMATAIEERSLTMPIIPGGWLAVGSVFWII